MSCILYAFLDKSFVFLQSDNGDYCSQKSIWVRRLWICAANLSYTELRVSDATGRYEIGFQTLQGCLIVYNKHNYSLTFTVTIGWFICPVYHSKNWVLSPKPFIIDRFLWNFRIISLHLPSTSKSEPYTNGWSLLWGLKTILICYNSIKRILKH